MMIRVLSLLSALLLLGPLQAGAQSVAGAVNSSATIDMEVTGGGVRNLDFGTVAPGGSVDGGAGSEANASSAKWEFTGLKKNRTIALSFTLPANLTNGAATIPVTWSNAGYGSWCTRIDTDPISNCGAAGTNTGTFDPAGANITASTSLTGNANNNRVLTVWVGAKLGNPTIPANAPPGLYSGTATLVITY